MKTKILLHFDEKFFGTKKKLNCHQQLKEVIHCDIFNGKMRDADKHSSSFRRKSLQNEKEMYLVHFLSDVNF